MCRELRLLGLLAFTVFLAPGCGGTGEPPPNRDAIKIKLLVSSVVGEAGKPVAWIFAPEAGKKDQREYTQFKYEVLGEPNIQGENANVKVKVLKASRPVGEVDWALVRRDGTWLITQAPLPR
jgi:hypothetical protein